MLTVLSEDTGRQQSRSQTPPLTYTNQVGRGWRGWQLEQGSHRSQYRMSNYFTQSLTTCSRSGFSTSLVFSVLSEEPWELHEAKKMASERNKHTTTQGSEIGRADFGHTGHFTMIEFGNCFC